MVSYFSHTKEDVVKYEIEKQRVKDILNKKYHNDEEDLEYQRLYRLKNKQEQNDLKNKHII